MNALNHVSFIMDGNKRWSKKNNINHKKSYKKGAENLLNLSEYLFYNNKVNYVSAFALSSSNTLRSKNLLSNIINILNGYLDEFISLRNNYKFNVCFIGDFQYFKKDIADKINEINLKKKYSKNLIIALNYSGQNDIENASIQYALSKKKKKNFSDFLSTSSFPNPEILIRSGGFNRLSDFFLYQTSFTELFFVKKLWPDFNKHDLSKIIKKYNDTERKFGK